MKTVKIYTDGSCRGNPGPGGWAAILCWDVHTKEFSGSEMATTNNRMEMSAVINGLNALKQQCHVEVYTDSQYVKNGLMWMNRWKVNGWKTASGRDVKNKDLWLSIYAHSQYHDISFIWVPGHADVPLNERANELAQQASGRAANNGI